MNTTNFNLALRKSINQYRVLDIDLSTARAKEEIEGMEGKFLWIEQEAFDDEDTVSSTLTTGNATIRFDSQQSDPLLLKAGRVYKTITPFAKIFLSNAAQSNKSIRLVVSTEAEAIPFDTEVQIVGDNPATGEVSNSANAVSTTAVVILAANANRKSYEIQNDDATLDLIILGTDSSGTAAQGIRVSKNGGYYTADETGAIYGITASGTIALANIRVKENVA